jgi:hypothetical protein
MIFKLSPIRLCFFESHLRVELVLLRILLINKVQLPAPYSLTKTNYENENLNPEDIYPIGILFAKVWFVYRINVEVITLSF